MPGRPAELEGRSNVGARPIYARAWETRAATAAAAAAEAAAEAATAAASAGPAVDRHSTAQAVVEPLLRFPCSHLHVFHAACATPWLRKAGMCPSCRVSVHPSLPKPSSTNWTNSTKSAKATGRGNSEGSSRRPSSGGGDVRAPDERYTDQLLPGSPPRARRGRGGQSTRGEGQPGAPHSPSFSPMRPSPKSKPRGDSRRDTGGGGRKGGGPRGAWPAH